jgi:hypothetical protein
MGHSRPSHFVPVLNNVRYASDSNHSRYESELTLWAKSRHSALQQTRRVYYEAVLEIHETEQSVGRLSHLVIKLAFVVRLRRRDATKSRKARVLNGSWPGPRWTRLTGNASGSYLASTIFSLLSATAFAA